MKFTRRQLERIIREELQASLLREDVPPEGEGGDVGDTATTTRADGSDVTWTWDGTTWQPA